MLRGSNDAQPIFLDDEQGDPDVAKVRTDRISDPFAGEDRPCICAGSARRARRFGTRRHDAGRSRRARRGRACSNRDDAGTDRRLQHGRY